LIFLASLNLLYNAGIDLVTSGILDGHANPVTLDYIKLCLTSLLHMDGG